ncbi:hypothetical protein CANARDRAFT_5823 [[Candida] arabinofermentans NRRL YB-2248]|uniref:Uncharacterized protein n=1 Tax=[Candida] arabinofermentans NRRL YB-2248 TaxID=983967 RepID=A0A1E4T699_9ASCO|nr:hypothetical protein CANARDRAFT_5823 [[Candida] arabinofermentans NRRL YB-2248]
MSYGTGQGTRPQPQPPLNVIDPNEDVPSEAPPSYQEAIGSWETPNIPSNSTSSSLPGVNQSRPTQNVMNSGSGKFSSSSVPPPQPPRRPSQQHGTSPAQASIPHHPGFLNGSSSSPSSPTSSSSSSGRKTEDLYTNNLSLPWRYPKRYYCSKCKNTGYKIKNGKQCKDCWSKFNKPQQLKPPVNSPMLINTQHPTPLNPNVVQLPPGRIYTPSSIYQPYQSVPIPYHAGALGMAPPINTAPIVVQPGDPRIGGQLCPRCRGRGMVHFLLDLERCTVCNGLGRVGV